MQQMIDLMQQQMKTVTDLQAENVRLREASAQTGITAAVPSGPNSQYSAKKPVAQRPVLDVNVDDRDWAIFIDIWDRYKKMCKLTDADIENIRLELRASCSTEVNKLLFEYVGPSVLNSCTEAQLLQHMKSVAVKIVQKEVHRLDFNSMLQEDGESITRWVARLRAKAFLCEFTVPCTCCTPAKEISYAEEEIAQRLIAGLRNKEHTRRILADATNLKTLEEKIERLQVLETTEQSASSLSVQQHNTAAAASKSQYKAGKSTPKPEVEGQIQTCQWCGLPSHPGGKPLERSNCPANNKKCSRCQRKGHFGRVCKNSQAAPANSTGRNDDNMNDETLSLPPADASVTFSFATHEQDFRKVRNPAGGS